MAFALLILSLSAEAAQSPAASAAPQRPVSVSEDQGTWRRDPFIGSVKKGDAQPAAKGISSKAGAKLANPDQEQGQDIQLQGIMLVDKAFHALINGRSVKTGDTIGGVTIKQISRYEVVVFNERKEKIISFVPCATAPNSSFDFIES